MSRRVRESRWPYGHYHLHDTSGVCYGDSDIFETAALVAAEHAYPWMVPDREDGLSDPLTVIDAPHCIEDCREPEDEDA